MSVRLSSMVNDAEIFHIVAHVHECTTYIQYKAEVIYVICGIDRAITYVSIRTINLRNSSLFEKKILILFFMNFL